MQLRNGVSYKNLNVRKYDRTLYLTITICFFTIQAWLFSVCTVFSAELEQMKQFYCPAILGSRWGVGKCLFIYLVAV